MEFDEIFFEWNFWSGALDKVDLLDDLALKIPWAFGKLPANFSRKIQIRRRRRKIQKSGL
jgi:hypothetical protein